MGEISETKSIPRTESYYPEPEKTKKRDRTEVTADILRVCSSGATKTQIVYRANLNFKILKTYLARLIPADLLKPDADGKRYYTTGAGEEFIYHAEMVVI